MLQNAFPKATDVNSPSCFSNPSSYKYRGPSPKYSELSPSCGGLWLLQLVPYYLRTNTCKIDIIWHGNEASSWWQTSTEFWLSGGMGLPDFCYQHFIFSLLWTRNHSGDRLHSFMFADKYRSDTSLTTQKPFLIWFRYLFLIVKVLFLRFSSTRVLTKAIFYNSLVWPLLSQLKDQVLHECCREVLGQVMDRYIPFQKVASPVYGIIINNLSLNPVSELTLTEIMYGSNAPAQKPFYCCKPSQVRVCFCNKVLARRPRFGWLWAFRLLNPGCWVCRDTLLIGNIRCRNSSGIQTV